MAQNRPHVTNHMFLVLVALAAWLAPGAGHFMIGQRKRALIIFVSITFAVLIGLYVGSIAVIDPVGAKAWYAAQLLNSPVIIFLGNITRQNGLAVFGKAGDVGQIYTSIAGMLNLLCVVNAVYMAYAGKTTEGQD